MRQRLSATLVGAVVMALSACEGGASESEMDPLSAVIAASAKTISAGPSEVQASVLGPPGDYTMSGQLDPDRGYRLCAVIDRDSSGYLRGRSVWLEERNGTYGTLTAPLTTRAPSPAANPSCPLSGWFDDHPPTLPLYQQKGIEVPPGGETGAEDFLHATLLALTQTERSAIEASAPHTCGDLVCYRVLVDFGRFDREPVRDEDLWTLRPLLRSLGTHAVEFRVDSQGFIERMRLATPSLVASDPTPSVVAVDLRLSGFGDAAAVPRAQATAIE